MTDRANELLRILTDHAVGRANAITADVLGRLTGMSRRKVQEAVEELRNELVFVASARTGEHRGLYLPADESERNEALGSFRSATLSQIRTYNRLKRARRVRVRERGQATLF